jgi:hypothetical protein
MERLSENIENTKKIMFPAAIFAAIYLALVL